MPTLDRAGASGVISKTSINADVIKKLDDEDQNQNARTDLMLLPHSPHSLLRLSTTNVQVAGTEIKSQFT
jgi:hypothetical protein